jgi:pro-kumamolisin-like protein
MFAYALDGAQDMIRMRRARLTAGLLLGVGAVVVPLAGASGAAAASSQSPNTPTQVPGGINAAVLPGASVFGDTPPDTQETVSFVLKEQDISSLESQVEAGIPQSNYLSVGQFAARYGQPLANIDALTSYLAGFGITTSVYPDDVNVVATGTAGDFNQALTITEENVNVPQQAGFGGFGPIRAQQVYSPKQAPLLPYRLASFVTAILGLSDYGPFVSDIAKPSSYSTPQQGSPNACVTKFGLPNGCHLPSDFAKWYDLDPLYAKGATGAGQTLGIVTLAAVDSGAPQYFWDNISHTTRTGTFAVDSIDGGAPGPNLIAGSDETAQHRLRVLRRVLHRRQPERRQHGLHELGRVRDGDRGRRPVRPGVLGSAGRVRRGVPGNGGAGAVDVCRFRRRGSLRRQPRPGQYQRVDPDPV